MNINYATHLAHAAFVLSQLIYSFATGQEQSLQQYQSAEASQSKPSQEQLTNYFAGSLMLMNEGTIKMSKTAEEKSKNDEVKSFAKKLAEEHTKLNDRLQKLAPLIAQRLDIRTADNKHSVGFRGTQEVEQVAQGDYLLDKVLLIQKDASDNYQQSSNKMIDRYQGQDFDMAFLGMQIGAHTWALAELKAIHSIGNQQFRQVVADATSAVQQHLQEAQELSKKFEDDE